jgi:ABC-type xylose transport system permease subunit
MTRTRRIWLTIYVFVSLIMLLFTIGIYLTPPGLHYLVIWYDSIIMFVLGMIFILSTVEIKNYYRIGLSLVSGAILTSLPVLIDGHASEWTVKIGLIIALLSFVIIFRMMYLYWYVEK